MTPVSKVTAASPFPESPKAHKSCVGTWAPPS
jgi:hypothetical protein